MHLFLSLYVSPLALSLDVALYSLRLCFSSWYYHSLLHFSLEFSLELLSINLSLPNIDLSLVSLYSSLLLSLLNISAHLSWSLYRCFKLYSSLKMGNVLKISLTDNMDKIISPAMLWSDVRRYFSLSLISLSWSLSLDLSLLISLVLCVCLSICISLSLYLPLSFNKYFSDILFFQCLCILGHLYLALLKERAEIWLRTLRIEMEKLIRNAEEPVDITSELVVNRSPLILPLSLPHSFSLYPPHPVSLFTTLSVFLLILLILPLSLPHSLFFSLSPSSCLSLPHSLFFSLSPSSCLSLYQLPHFLFPSIPLILSLSLPHFVFRSNSLYHTLSVPLSHSLYLSLYVCYKGILIIYSLFSKYWPHLFEWGLSYWYMY